MIKAIRRTLTTWRIDGPSCRVRHSSGLRGLWFALDRATMDWHGFATLATLCMTLFIQRAEHRDTQALQAKLDELLRVNDAARNDLTSLDRKEPEEIEKQRAQRKGSRYCKTYEERTFADGHGVSSAETSAVHVVATKKTVNPFCGERANHSGFLGPR